MKSRIALLFFVVVLAILSYFACPIVKNRYFKSEPKVIQNKEAQQNAGDRMQEKDIGGEIKSSSIEVTILPSDCDNECSKFQKSDELEYCKQVCGLSSEQTSAENETKNNCENATGLQKDYCLKNLAVQNKDFKACDQISDSGIKKACKNRISEDIIESQSNSQ